MQTPAEINATIRSLKMGDVVILQTEGMKKARQVVVNQSGFATWDDCSFIGTTGPKGWSEITRHMKGGCLRASDSRGAEWRSTMNQPPKALILLEVVARA